MVLRGVAELLGVEPTGVAADDRDSESSRQRQAPPQVGHRRIPTEMYARLRVPTPR
ncbi:MAG: hypothetical protein JWQ59_1105 [Cryobacterium sp.]|jgi:hypothetical protein|nr:hypothetical protein [Cryobacterium sp.]